MVQEHEREQPARLRFSSHGSWRASRIASPARSTRPVARGVDEVDTRSTTARSPGWFSGAPASARLARLIRSPSSPPAPRKRRRSREWSARRRPAASARPPRRREGRVAAQEQEEQGVIPSWGFRPAPAAARRISRPRDGDERPRYDRRRRAAGSTVTSQARGSPGSCSAHARSASSNASCRASSAASNSSPRRTRTPSTRGVRSRRTGAVPHPVTGLLLDHGGSRPWAPPHDLPDFDPLVQGPPPGPGADEA